MIYTISRAIVRESLLLISKTIPLFVSQCEPLPWEGLCLCMRFQVSKTPVGPGVRPISLQHFSFYFSRFFSWKQPVARAHEKGKCKIKLIEKSENELHHVMSQDVYPGEAKPPDGWSISVWGIRNPLNSMLPATGLRIPNHSLSQDQKDYFAKQTA